MPKPEYCDIFKCLTDFFVEHLPRNLMPHWSFDFTESSDKPWDSSPRRSSENQRRGGLAQISQSAESKELESAKRTLEQLETTSETEATEAETSSAQSTLNLASLTEQQIETLVKEGGIARAEADSELASCVEPEA